MSVSVCVCVGVSMYCIPSVPLQALLMLPRFIRRDYRQFMAQPLLIAEQLLMDLKVSIL